MIGEPKRSRDHFPPLDGLRGVAILLVLVVHTFSYTGRSVIGRGLESAARSGWVGVTLFFVLSGFLITGILLDTKGRPYFLRDFYARRSLRIFPLYFAFLACYFFVVPGFTYLSDRLPQPEPGVGIYYWTYLSNMIEWLAGPNKQPRPLAPLWSLAVEEQVYLVWPLVIASIPRGWLPGLFVGAGIFSFGWRGVTRLTAQPIMMSYAWAPANLEAFAAGALVAWLSRERGEWLAAWSLRAAAGSGLFVAGMVAVLLHFNFWYAPVPILTVGTTGAVVFFAALIGCSVTTAGRSILNMALSPSWLRLLGKYSYAIYLFHETIIALLRPLWFSPRTGFEAGNSVAAALLFTIVVTACSFAAALCSWHVWEGPFLSLKRYFPLSGRVVHLAATEVDSVPPPGPPTSRR